MKGTFTIEFKEHKERMQEYCCEDIFNEIECRFIKALMFHSDMACMFSFLGLQGFKRMHEYQYFDESKERMEMHHFYLDHCNKLIMGSEDSKGIHDKGIGVIPFDWAKYTRMDISAGVVSKHTKQAFEQYKGWEEQTKCLYECCSCLLAEKGEVVLSNYVAGLAEGVQKELKEIYRMIECLNIAEYDWRYILDIQKRLHDKYKKCMKHIF